MKSIHLVNHEKGSIHLVDGEKGGIGKSTFCRLLIEYLQDEVKIDPVNMEIIDADKDQPLVGRTYAPHHYLKEEIFDNDNSSGVSNFNDVAKQIALIYFTDNEKLLSQTDVILELASSKNVIVNLPAAVFSLVNRWMQDGGMLNLADELNIPIYKWFVTDGCQETIDTLKKSYFIYEDKIHHIIVKNKGIASTERDWWAFDGDEDLKMYLELYQETTSTIEMAQLLVGTSNYEAFKKRNLPIRDVANLQKAKELGFLMTQAGRFRQWRNLSFESLNTLSWEQLSDGFSTKNQDNSVDLAVVD
jgi:hypothetical protein